MNQMRVYIIGAGPGHEQCLTMAARETLQKASLVVTTPRLYERFCHLNPHILSRSVGELTDTLVAARGQYNSVAVLVSGDVGFFSASSGLASHLSQFSDIKIEYLNGLNTLQYFCGQLGLAYEKAKVVSMHGREGCILPHVAYNPLVFVLSGGAIKAHSIIGTLVEAGLGSVEVAVGENLSSQEERIVSGTANGLRGECFADLASLLIRNDAYTNPHNILADKDFIRGRVPMTKQAVRSIAVDSLNIQPDDCLWDIGTGTGSVGIAMARRAYRGRVFAIERKTEAVNLVRQNRVRHGAYNMTIVEGCAPECFAGLPTPDKVFIGGSGSRLSEIVDRLKNLNPQVCIVVTAISLETLQEAMQVFGSSSVQGADGTADAMTSSTTAEWASEIMCVNAAAGDKVGGYHLMKAENPVYIIKGQRRGELLK